MAYHVLPKRLVQLGFCCPYLYFAANAQISTIDVARELKVNVRTARRWRAKYHAGHTSCLDLHNCLTLRKVSSLCSDSARASAEDLDLSPNSESESSLP